MDFDKFPAQWEWVALIIGALGFLMGGYTFVEAIWGRPKLKVMTHQRDVNSVRVLEIIQVKTFDRLSGHWCRSQPTGAA